MDRRAKALPGALVAGRAMIMGQKQTYVSKEATETCFIVGVSQEYVLKCLLGRGAGRHILELTNPKNIWHGRCRLVYARVGQACQMPAEWWHLVQDAATE